MNLQTDLFGAGETDSIPPHLDPARVAAIEVRPARDTDHVGTEDVGRYGNDTIVYVVEVHGRCGEILFAEQCPTDQQATRLANQIGAKLNGNRQQTLFA
jgi:hypothetical protein